MDQQYPDSIKEQSIWLGRILDVNYEKADLEQEVNKLIDLTKFQRVILPSCLKQCKDLFVGDLGEWAMPLVDIPIKDESKPYHTQDFPIMFIHIESLKIFG